MTIGVAGTVILILFLFILLVYSIGGFFILYHLIRFGIGIEPKRVALLFFCGSVILLFITALGFLASYPAVNTYFQSISQHMLAQPKV